MKVSLGVLLCLTALQTGAAGPYAFSFQLDGPDAHDATVSPGLAYGTITSNGPSVLTLNMTWHSLSAPITQIVAFVGFSQVFWPEDVWSGWVLTLDNTTLPTSGSITINYDLQSIGPAVFEHMAEGFGYLSVSTQNYPFYSQGEIGGLIQVPEPSALALFAASGGFIIIVRQRILPRTWFRPLVIR